MLLVGLCDSRERLDEVSSPRREAEVLLDVGTRAAL